MSNLTKLSVQLKKIVDEFYKASQQMTTSVDTSLVDGIKKSHVGQGILTDASTMLNNKAVSSITVKVLFNRPSASFEVNSMGSDSEQVDKDLTALLNQKYSKSVAPMLARAKADSFGFNLFTVQ